MERFADIRRAAHPGLCLTCDNQKGCLYPRMRQRPVLQCLEYEELSEGDAEHTPAPQERGPRGRAHKTLGISLSAEPRRTEPGLCADCELRATCTYPRLPGGVWFCEEFR